MKNIVFLGPPGSGKGTQSAILENRTGFVKLSTGDLLREISKGTTNLAAELREKMSKGEFISDEVVTEIILEKITDLIKEDKKGVIFDGYPRTLAQARFLDQMLDKLGLKVDCVIHMSATKETVIKRVSGRYNCANCNEGYNKFFKNVKNEGICDKCGSTNFIYREDDNENIVATRLEIYNEQINQIEEYYAAQNKLYKINADNDINLITDQIMNVLKI